MITSEERVVLHLIVPALTAPGHPDAQGFVDAALVWLRPYVEVCEHLDRYAAEGASVNDGDGVIYIHPPNGADHPRWVEEWFGRVADRAVFATVALDAESRRPPAAASQVHVFDLADRVRELGSTSTDVPIAAREFASQTLAAVQPTLRRDRLRFFLSYRRTDGEELAAALANRLKARQRHNIFRDLHDLNTAAEFRRQLDEALDNTDVLILLDTPDLAKSTFVEDEVTIALARNIPVVWLRVAADGLEPRMELRVPPSDEPSVEIESADHGALSDETVNEVVGAGCRLAYEQARQARITLSRLRALADRGGWQLRPLDMRQLVFEVRGCDMVAGGFPRRPRTDIVQFFGWHPQDDDRRNLVQWLESRQLGPHGEAQCRSYDAAVLLAPLARSAKSAGADSVVVAHAARYQDSLMPIEQPRAQPSAPQGAPRLLLLGGFPTDQVRKAQLLAAAGAFVRVWLARGGSVTFGGHPSITGLVVRIAADAKRGNLTPAVTVYQSTWWEADQPTLQEAPPAVRVVHVAKGDDLAASLTVMRRRMVADDPVAAAVAIGGRTIEGGAHRPGVDEEIELARAAGVPVFLIGAPGGRAAQIAAREAESEWAGTGNSLDASGNTRLLHDEDFEALAEVVWSSVAG